MNIGAPYGPPGFPFNPRDPQAGFGGISGRPGAGPGPRPGSGPRFAPEDPDTFGMVEEEDLIDPTTDAMRMRGGRFGGRRIGGLGGRRGIPPGYAGMDPFMRTGGLAGRTRLRPGAFTGGRRPTRPPGGDMLDDDQDEGGPAKGANTNAPAEDNNESDWEDGQFFDFE